MTKEEKIKQLSEKYNLIKTEITLKADEQAKIGRELAPLLCGFNVGDIVSDSYVNYILDDVFIYRRLEVGLKGRRITNSGEPYKTDTAFLHGYISLPHKWSLVKRGKR